MAEENSRLLAQRNKKITKIGDLLITAGAATVAGPAGSAAYGITKLITANVVQLVIKEREERRLAAFHERLLSGNIDYKEREKILQTEIDSEDYYTLLKAALQDDEDRKTARYAELFRKLTLSEIPKEYNLFFTKTARELTAYELDLIQNIYIYRNYDLIPKQGPLETLSSLLSEQNTLNKIAVSNLVRLQFLQRNNENIEVSNECFEAALAFFNKEELTPKFIGREVWRKEQTAVVVPNEYSHFSEKVQLALREYRFRPSGAFIIGPNIIDTISRGNPTIIVVVVGPTAHSGFSNVQEINELVKDLVIPPEIRVIKILIRHNNKEPYNDYLTNLQEIGTVKHTMNEPLDLLELGKVLGLLNSNEP